MANSNAKILRKKVASEVESEILTINTELENIVWKVKLPNLKKLSKIDYTRLTDLRSQIQEISRTVKRVNNNLERLDKLHDFGIHTVIETENGQEVTVSERAQRKLLPKPTKENL